MYSNTISLRYFFHVHVFLMKLPNLRKFPSKSENSIVSHLTYASSACYKAAFNKLKLHVIELDKVKELIYRSFFVDFFTRNTELKFNMSEDFIEKSPQPFLQSFLEYFKLSGMLSVYLLCWN